MSLSNFLENELLDHIRGSAYSVPSGLYIKLHTADPGEDCTTAAATETDRKSCAFDAASAGSMDLTSTVEWTDVAASETYSHFSVWDALTAGNPLGSGALNSSVAVTAGDTFRITAATWSLE